jgi:GlcNAc-P-P-Und epimerase
MGLLKLAGKNLPVSSIRVKKFVSSTEFRCAKKSLAGFKAPFKLEDGIARTLQSEFVAPDPSLEIFYTE